MYEHGALLSENRALVLREQSTVLREPEHCSPRTGARFSKNQSAPKLENRKTPQWRTGEHLHVLHVLRTYSTCSHPGW